MGPGARANRRVGHQLGPEMEWAPTRFAPVFLPRGWCQPGWPASRSRARVAALNGGRAIPHWVDQESRDLRSSHQALLFCGVCAAPPGGHANATPRHLSQLRDRGGCSTIDREFTGPSAQPPSAATHPAALPDEQPIAPLGRGCSAHRRKKVSENCRVTTP